MAEAWRSAPLADNSPAAPSAPTNTQEPAWKSAPIVEMTPRGVLPKGEDIGGKPFPHERPIPEDAPFHSAITGAGRTEFPDAPEFGTAKPPLGEALPVLGSYLLATDDKSVQDVVLENVEGAEAKEDKYGNPMISYQGQDYYVNKPGLSTADMVQFGGQGVAFTPAARFGAAGKTMIRRMGRTGSASAGTSVATDKAVQALGSKQDVDKTKAAVAGAGGALFEGLTPLAVRAWRAIFRKNRLFDPNTGTLSEEGRDVAEQAGLNPDTMTERLARQFAEEARDATDPKYAAGRIAGTESNIPYTRGQATQEFKQLSKEEATRHGAFGDEAGDIIRDFDEAQQLAMQGRREGIQTEIAGGERSIARPAQAGDAIAEGVQARAQRLGAQIDAAYEAARQTDARLTAKSLRGLTRRLGKSIKDDFDVDAEEMPKTVRALRNIARLERRVTKQSKSGRITAVAFRQVERERRKVNRLIDDAKDSDRAALVRVKNAFDEWIDEAFDNHLFSGDIAALEKMKNARALRTEYGRLFEPKNPSDAAGKTIQSIIQDETITPEQVINNIFGRQKLGQKETSVQIVERLKNIAGVDSPDWAALREAAWLRLSKQIGTDKLSPKVFKNNLDKVMEENRSLMNALFTPDEMAMFQRFRDDVMRTVTPERATNPSKTGYTAARLIREWLGRVGTMFTFSGSPIGGAIFFTMKRAPQMMGKKRARKAVRKLPPSAPTAPLLTAPATGAAASGSEDLPPANRLLPRQAQ